MRKVTLVRDFFLGCLSTHLCNKRRHELFQNPHEPGCVEFVPESRDDARIFQQSRMIAPQKMDHDPRIPVRHPFVEGVQEVVEMFDSLEHLTLQRVISKRLFELGAQLRIMFIELPWCARVLKKIVTTEILPRFWREMFDRPKKCQQFIVIRFCILHERQAITTSSAVHFTDVMKCERAHQEPCIHQRSMFFCGANHFKCNQLYRRMMPDDQLKTACSWLVRDDFAQIMRRGGPKFSQRRT